ncbi:hypothetical protein J4464_02765 [Candidatus Woesearchaeota archaeon]|nr:hypothetical protein [Candidatus Woesearchaeota archaeon]
MADNEELTKFALEIAPTFIPDICGIVGIPHRAQELQGRLDLHVSNDWESYANRTKVHLSILYGKLPRHEIAHEMMHFVDYCVHWIMERGSFSLAQRNGMELVAEVYGWMIAREHGERIYHEQHNIPEHLKEFDRNRQHIEHMLKHVCSTLPAEAKAGLRTALSTDDAAALRKLDMYFDQNGHPENYENPRMTLRYKVSHCAQLLEEIDSAVEHKSFEVVQQLCRRTVDFPGLVNQLFHTPFAERVPYAWALLESRQRF